MTGSPIELADMTVRPISGGGLPLCVEPLRPAADLTATAAMNLGWIEQALLKHGALLFRGFAVSGQSDFERFARGLCPELADYVYRSTPRTTVGAGVYTATEYPADATIPQHNETAYARDWPMKIMFHCVEAAAEGGETPLASSRGVTARISATTRDKFKALGVSYVRNYRDRFDLPWPVVFQTNDPAEVERYCREHHVDFEWRSDGTLRTRQVCQGLAVHPKTGEELWFNQAHLFHISSIDEKTRTALLKLFHEEGLPRNAYYGDGSPLEPEVLEEIRGAFASETVKFSWRPGDVLLVDNMLVSHGRTPFKGPRKILVSMGELFSTFADRRVYPTLPLP
jgi:alpha-ketoglutarate-dependent taurine dioxygenase